MFCAPLLVLSLLLMALDFTQCNGAEAWSNEQLTVGLEKLTTKFAQLESTLSEARAEELEKLGETLGQALTAGLEKLGETLTARERDCKPADDPNPERPGPRPVSFNGSVYVRWGSGSCPDEAETVYSGVVGGGHYSHGGAGVNALCLTTDPVYDGHSRTTHVTYLYGAEYETTPESVHDLDVVCAVCASPRAMTLMIPGTNTCRPGWTREYHGHLMAGYYTQASGTEFICMDGAMEADHSSHKNDNGKVFYYVLGQCGSLPCPPYQNDKVVTCVVCSK